MALSTSDWVWNPYTVLNLDLTASGFTCVGLNRFKARCGWVLESHRISAARGFLDAMAKTDPAAVNYDSFRQIARWLLCGDWHQDQNAMIIASWKTLVADFLAEKKKQETRRIETSRSPRMQPQLAGNVLINQELEDLRRERYNMQEYTETLQDKKFELSAQVGTLTAQVLELRNIESGLCHEVQDTRARGEAAELRSSSRVNYLSSLVTKYQEELGSNAFTRRRIESAQAELANQNNELRSQVAAYRDDLNAKTVAQHQTETTQTALTKRNNTLHAELLAAQIELPSARQQLLEKDKALTEQKAASDAEVSRLKGIEERLKESIASEKRQLQQELETIRSTRSAKVLQLNEQIRDLQAAMQAQIAASEAKLHQQRTSSGAEITRLREEIDRLKSRGWRTHFRAIVKRLRWV